MKRYVSIFLILMLCASVLGSKNYLVIKIWSGLSKESHKMNRSELTVFEPDNSIRNGAAVIICPGGSYCYLGMKHEGYQVAQWLNSLGFTAFVLRYRVGIYGNHFPSEIQDLQRTIEIVRENADKWKINPDKVGVMGFSAGGHLVGTASEYYHENFMLGLGITPLVSLRPDFTVMIYPVISMHDSIAHKKSKRNLLGSNHTKELENKMSLEDNVHDGMPPIYLMQAKKDEVVDSRNSLYFYKALIKENVKVHYQLFDCKGHGFGIDPKRNPIAWQWIFDCQKWFESIGLTIHTDNKTSSL